MTTTPVDTPNGRTGVFLLSFEVWSSAICVISEVIGALCVVECEEKDLVHYIDELDSLRTKLLAVQPAMLERQEHEA